MLGVLFAISVITFAIFNVIPNGDPAVRLAGKSPTPDTLAAIRRAYGFDKPVPVQYVKTMQKVLTADLVSYTNPGVNVVPLTEDPIQWAYHLILPWTALSILFIGFYSRILRSNLLDTMSEDYVRTARAKGISERRILLRHVLRNSMIPIVTLFGLDFGAVVGGGAILTEVVFNLQGVGQYAAESIRQLDIPPVLAITMFGAFFIVLMNVIVDIVYAALDPRIRLS